MGTITDQDGTSPTRYGPYVVRARLGEGGFGTVHLGMAPDGRRVAIKVVKPEYAGSSDFRARFEREVNLLRKVSGPYIVQLLDDDVRAACPWLVTEYVPGPSLADLVPDHGVLGRDALRWVAARVAVALGHIHSHGVTHRDLKPANVLVWVGGLRVIDFGIARGVDERQITQFGQAAGTPAFMAPEQLLGSVRYEPFQPELDVFSLGATLAMLGTRHPPFGTGAPAAIFERIKDKNRREWPYLDGLERRMQRLLRRCLSFQAKERPTVSDVLAEVGDDSYQDVETGAVERLFPSEMWQIIRQREEAYRHDLARVPPPADPADAGPATRRQEGAPPFYEAPPPGAHGTRGYTRVVTDPRAVGLAGPSTVTRQDPGSTRPMPEQRQPASRPPKPLRTLPYSPPSTDVPASWRRRTGRPWVFRAPGPIRSRALPFADTVVVGSAAGTVHALDVRTGKERWRFDAEGSVRIGAAPNAVYAASTDGYLYALDVPTGAQRWRAEAPAGAELAPVASGDMVYLACGDGSLHAFEAAEGTRRWRCVVAREIWSGPVVGDTAAYLTTGDGLLAVVDLASGEVRRPGTVGGSGARELTLTGGRLVVGLRGRVVVHGADTATPHWQCSTGESESAAAAAVADGTVYVGDGRGAVHAFALDDGGTGWRQDLGAGLDAAPAVEAGRVYVGCHDGGVHALDARTGERLWATVTSARIDHAPTVAHGLVYVGSRDGYVSAFDADEGRGV